MQQYFFYVKIQHMDIIEVLKGKVIISSQAMPAEPFYDEKCMMAMMQSVINGGAAGLRVAGKRDVINAKTFNVPVIGLTKPDKLPENWKSYNTQIIVNSEGAPTEQTIEIMGVASDCDIVLADEELKNKEVALLEKGLQNKALAPDTVTPEELAELREYDLF